MPKSVPFLSDRQIEHEAAALLAEFSVARGVDIEAPIPIDDIVEKYLKLGIEFDDTHRMFGVPRDPGGDPDILGAIFFDERRIVIDGSLDPVENAFKEGRYRFTLAHEGGGHWRLHRRHFAKDPAQTSLFSAASPPSVVCRSSQAKERIEWQADRYAACLLMPKNLLLAAWEQRFGDKNPRVLKSKRRLSLREGTDDDVAAAIRTVEQQRDDEALNEFARPFADTFQVSMMAMRIRLEGIGLLHREVPPQRSFNVAP